MDWATCYNTLQHAATRCNTLNRSCPAHYQGASIKRGHCNTLQHGIFVNASRRAACYNTLQHTALRCNTLSWICPTDYRRASIQRGTATHCNALQHGIHVNASRRAHARVIPHARASQESQTHIWMHHCTHMDETWCTRDGVMALMWMRHFADMKESYLTCELLHTVTHTQ